MRTAFAALLRDARAGDDPGLWLTLDAEARYAGWYRAAGRPPWGDPGGPASSDEAGLALGLCHGDGRIRERALRHAAAHPALLPLVVIRTADWAAPVREGAREMLRGTIDVTAAVDLAPLALLVARRERGDAALALIGAVLRTADGEDLLPLLRHTDRDVRRFAHRLIVAEGLLTPGELARTAARDEDAVVQTLCAEAALAGLADAGGEPRGADADEVLAPLLAARGPQVRAAGVTALRRTGRPERARDFLADRSALVRACARYVLRQYGVDPLPWYRSRCADAGGPPPLRPGAVIGLAECGGRADAELLAPLLAHPRPGVRARAVAGLRLLGAADPVVLLPLLDDPAPGVVREATTALLPSARSLDEALLTARLAPGRPRQARVAAFRLLDAYGGLVRLRAATALLEDRDDRLRTWAGQSVQGWHATPDVPRGATEVGELLDRARHLFSPYVLRRRAREAGIDG